MDGERFLARYMLMVIASGVLCVFFCDGGENILLPLAAGLIVVNAMRKGVKEEETL